MCIYKITSNAYAYLDVYLDFSPLVLLFEGFFILFECLFGCWLFLSFYYGMIGLCKNHDFCWIMV